MRYRHLRRTVIAVLATVAFVLLLGLLLRTVLEAEPTRRLAIRQLERLAAGYGAELEVGDLHWGLLPPGIRLDGVVLQTAGVSAEVDSLRIELGRMRLTQRTVELDTVAARGVRLSIDGIPRRSGRGSAPLKIRVRRLLLEDVEFAGTDLPGKLALDLNGVRTAWSTEAGEARGFAEVGRARLQAGKMKPFEATVKARFLLGDDGLELGSFRIDGTGFELRGRGRVASTGLRLEASGQVDVGWLDRELKTKGLLDGTAEFSGIFDTAAPELVRVEVRSPHLEAAGFPLDDVKGRMTLEGRRLNATLERARFHGGTLRGEYHLGEFGGAYPHDVRLEGRSITVTGLLENLNIESAGLAATMDVDIDSAWNGKRLGAGRGQASVMFYGASPGLPVDGHMNIAFEGDGLLRFDAEKLAIGSSEARWQGALSLGTWKTAWSVAIEPAVVAEVVPLVNAWVGSTILPDDLAGTGEILVNLNGPFKDLVVSGRVDIHSPSLPPILFDRLVSEFSIQRSLLRLGSTRFQVADGFGEVEGEIAWGETSGDNQLNLDVRANRIPVAAVASWIDLDQWVDGGRLSLTGRLRGPLALPRGSWAVGLDDFKLAGLELGDASAAVDLVDGTLACHDLRCDQGLEADLWWNVPAAEIGGTLSWPQMPLAVLGDSVTRLAGDFANVDLQFLLPLSGRPVGEFAALSEHARVEMSAGPDTVQIEVQLTEAAHARADLTRGTDGALHGDGELVLSSAQELLAHLAPDSGVPLIGTARAAFTVDWGDEAWPSLAGRLDSLELELEDHPVHLIEPADFSLSSAGFVVPGLRLRAREDEMFVRWAIDSEGALSGNLAGTIDALLLRFLLPDWEPAGRATGVVEFLGTVEDPLFEGVAEIDGGSFRLPGTRTILSQVEGTALLSSSEVGLEEMDFRIMRGRGRCGGRIWQRDESTVLNLAGEVNGVRFEVLPGLEARLSGPWQLIGPVDDLELSGNITLDRMTLKTKDDVATILLDWFGGAARTAAEGGLRLNLHLEAEDTIQLNNPSVRLTGSASLEVSGTSNRPGLVGRLEFQEGGETTLLGNRYEIERGNLSFSNPEAIDPFIDLQASTWVQEFQITVHLTGTLDHFVPTVVSTPPLAAPDIYSLLGVGYRDEGLGSGAMGLGLASSILSQQLTSALSRRAQLVLPVDQVRVDPFSANSTGNPTARLSVVKQITPYWTVILQSTLSGEREQLVVSRWYLAPGLFIEAAQHEDGSLSLDLKLRRPY